MTKALIWLGLFAATAITDWLSARWTDAPNARVRASLSAVHEMVGLVAGFTIYSVFHDWSMIVPCVLGAAAGSYWAGVDKPEPAVDADLVVACATCGRPFIAFTASETTCARCERGKT